LLAFLLLVLLPVAVFARVPLKRFLNAVAEPARLLVQALEAAGRAMDVQEKLLAAANRASYSLRATLNPMDVHGTHLASDFVRKRAGSATALRSA